MLKLKFKSFATRLSCYLISFTLIVFFAFMMLFYTYTREKISAHAVQHTHGLLKNMAIEINGALKTVEATMGQSTRLLEMYLSEPDSLGHFLAAVVECNPFIVGSGIAFRPDYFSDKGYYYMPYAVLSDGQMTSQVLGSKEYDYPCMDWYLIPTLQKKSYWSEPYYDEGGGNIIMATYALPLLDAKNEVFAVFTANISLSQFTDMVNRLKPYDSSYSFLLSRNGSYLTHPRADKIMNETIFSNAFEDNDKDYEEIGRQMIAGSTGTTELTTPKGKLYAFYTPISNSGWSVCNVCDDKIIFHELYSTSRNMIYMFVVGIILFFIISYYIIKRLVRPLEYFSRSAREIATGCFHVKLPEITAHDEMRTLHDSFMYMQTSLSAYVAELQQTTATKERFQSELNIAHEIQMGMIPKTFPPFPNRSDVDLFAMLIPAREVGGDLYDFFLIGDKLYFTVGDVSGKGIPASLFMAITRSLFRTLLSHFSSPREIISSMNDAISDNNETNMFVTMIIGCLDLSNGCLRFCNAGHNLPVIITPDGKAELISMKNNLFIGVMKNFEYEEEEIMITPGTKLLFYTDGVTEAENSCNEFYSEETLLNVLQENTLSEAKGVIDVVMESVRNFVGGATQSDDMTMLTIHYKPKLKEDGKRDSIE